MTSTGRTRARRQIIIRPGRSAVSAGVASRLTTPDLRSSDSVTIEPSGRSAGEVERRWFGTIPAVSANQNRDSPVSTRPLSGMAVGSTTSKADSRSDATRSKVSASMSYRSRTLPDRTNDSARGIDPLRLRWHRLIRRVAVWLGTRPGGAPDEQLGVDPIETADADRGVAQERRIVEAGIEPAETEPGRHGRLHRQQLAQGPTLVGCLQGGALDDRVGILPGEPAILNKRHKDPTAGMQAEPPLDVLAHPLRPDDESAHQPGYLHEHVIKQDRGVGQEDPLGAGVADVALMPQRLVLERRPGVAAQQAGGGRA